LALGIDLLINEVQLCLVNGNIIFED